MSEIVKRVYFSTPDGNVEYEDFHKEYGFFDRDGVLVITEGKYGEGDLIAQFPFGSWMYHRKVVVRDKPKPIKNYLFYHWDDKYEIDTGYDLVTETKEARYLTEDDGGQTVKDWAVIFEFSHRGFEIVDINDGVSQGTIEIACQAVLAYVVDRLRVVRELKEISKGEEK